MNTYLVERHIPGVGALNAQQRAEAASQSNRVLTELAPDVQWVTSYVTADKTYCIYRATSEDVIRTHAERSGFPANQITEIVNYLDPTTRA